MITFDIKIEIKIKNLIKIFKNKYFYYTYIFRYIILEYFVASQIVNKKFHCNRCVWYINRLNIDFCMYSLNNIVIL